MSAREDESAPGTVKAPPAGRASRPVPSGPRRIRQDAVQSLSVAALSLAASLGVTAALWALLTWLG